MQDITENQLMQDFRNGKNNTEKVLNRNSDFTNGESLVKLILRYDFTEEYPFYIESDIVKLDYKIYRSELLYFSFYNHTFEIIKFLDSKICHFNVEDIYKVLGKSGIKIKSNYLAFKNAVFINQNYLLDNIDLIDPETHSDECTTNFIKTIKRRNIDQTSVLKEFFIWIKDIIYKIHHPVEGVVGTTKELRIKLLNDIEKTKKEKGYIYVVTTNEQQHNNIFKIGHTINLKPRLSQQKCGSSEDKYYIWIKECYNPDMVDKHIRAALKDLKFYGKNSRTELYEDMPYIFLIDFLEVYINNYNTQLCRAKNLLELNY